MSSGADSISDKIRQAVFQRLAESFRERYRRKSAKGQKELKWITIGAVDHHGGTPVQIDGDGKIVKGPPKLKGDNVEEIGKKKDTRDEQPKRRRKSSKKAGYPPQNRIEVMLDQHLTANRPELIEELGSEYRHFLISRTSDTLDQIAEMVQQGMDPRASRHLAIRDMMEEMQEPEEPEESDEITPQETGDTPTETSSVED